MHAFIKVQNQKTTCTDTQVTTFIDGITNYMNIEYTQDTDTMNYVHSAYTVSIFNTNKSLQILVSLTENDKLHEITKRVSHN